MGECLIGYPEPENKYDSYAVKIEKNDVIIVGHMPKDLQFCIVFWW